MPVRKIERTPSAYAYPLLIKNILRMPLIYAPKQEIIYRDKMRYDYLALNRRISQLANMLEKIGVVPGMFFCGSHDGGGAPYRQHQTFTGTADLYHQSR